MGIVIVNVVFVFVVIVIAIVSSEQSALTYGTFNLLV